MDVLLRAILESVKTLVRCLHSKLGFNQLHLVAKQSPEMPPVLVQPVAQGCRSTGALQWLIPEVDPAGIEGPFHPLTSEEQCAHDFATNTREEHLDGLRWARPNGSTRTTWVLVEVLGSSNNSGLLLVRQGLQKWDQLSQ